MDQNSLEPLLPTALFSPSKAAAQRAQAQDWHTIDVWLSSKYQGRSVPVFERNEETLAALLALLKVNEKADEERDLIVGVWREGLVELSSGARVGDRESAALTNTLTTSLPTSGLSALSSLSTVSIILNAPSPSPSALLKTITDLTLTSQTQTQTLLRLSHLQRRLETQLQSLRASLYELRGAEFQGSRELGRLTGEWNRNTKQLRTKVSEYSDRLAALPSAQAGEGSVVEEVVRRERKVLELGERVRELEQEVKAFKGLPRDIEGARKEVERVRKEAAMLREKRDRLFEGLVG